MLQIVCLCCKIYRFYNSKSRKSKFSSKGMNKRALEDSGDDPMAKYRQVLDEARTLKTTNRELKTTNLLLQLMNKQKKN